jgi:hypothetical protein
MEFGLDGGKRLSRPNLRALTCGQQLRFPTQ